MIPNYGKMATDATDDIRTIRESTLRQEELLKNILKLAAWASIGTPDAQDKGAAVARYILGHWNETDGQ